MDVIQAFEKLVTEWHRFSEENKKKYANYKSRWKAGTLKPSSMLQIIEAANLDFRKYNPIVVDGIKSQPEIKNNSIFYLCPLCKGHKTYPISARELKKQIFPLLLPVLYREVYIRGIEIFRNGRSVTQKDLDDFEDICTEAKIYEIFAHVRDIRKHEFRLIEKPDELIIEAPCHLCGETGYFER